MKKFAVFVFLIAVATCVLPSCRRGVRNLERFASDSADIRSPLVPNEGPDAEFPTYGPDSIPGFSFRLRLPSDTATNTYVDFKVDLLETHPDITVHHLDFINEYLRWRDFLNEADSVYPMPASDSTGAPYSQYQVARNVLDWSLERVYRNLPGILAEDEQMLGPNYLEFIIAPVYLDDQYVTFKYYAGYYYDYVWYLVTYNLETGKSLELTDIVKDDKMRKVRERVATHMAAEYRHWDNINSVQAYLDSLNCWMNNMKYSEYQRVKDNSEYEFLTLDNFPVWDPTINKFGLAFSYARYEITLGACGCPVVVLTWDEIRDCLKEPFLHYADAADSPAAR